jgi:hypothetical protein
MLLPCEWDSSDGLSSILDEHALHDNGEDHDHYEEKIVEETVENVIFEFTELSAVDLIEYLHEHECVEYQCVVEYFIKVGYLL